MAPRPTPIASSTGSAQAEPCVRPSEVSEPREGILQEVERRHREHDAEERFDAHHPRPALGQADRERADQPEGEPKPEREGEERGGTEPSALGLADPQQDSGQDRPGARSRDEPAHQPEQEGAAVADAAELREPVGDERREHELESAEHRRGERQKDDRDEGEDPRVGERRAEETAGVAGDHAQRREHRRDAQHECGRQPHGVKAALALARAEDADRDGDHRVDAGSEAHQEAADERGEPGVQRAARQTTRERDRGPSVASYLGERALGLGDLAFERDVERLSTGGGSAHERVEVPHRVGAAPRVAAEPAQHESPVTLTARGSLELRDDAIEVADGLALRALREREVPDVERLVGGAPAGGARQSRSCFGVALSQVEHAAERPEVKGSTAGGARTSRQAQVPGGPGEIAESLASAGGVLVGHVGQNLQPNELGRNLEGLVEPTSLEMGQIELAQEHGLRGPVEARASG